MFKDSIRYALTTVVSLALVITAVHAANTWQAPRNTAPLDNAGAPITVSASNQTKTGGLWLGSLAVTGKAVSAVTVDADPDNTLVTKGYLNNKIPKSCTTGLITDASGNITCGAGPVIPPPAPPSPTYDCAAQRLYVTGGHGTFWGDVPAFVRNTKLRVHGRLHVWDNRDISAEVICDSSTGKWSILVVNTWGYYGNPYRNTCNSAFVFNDGVSYMTGCKI